MAREKEGYRETLAFLSSQGLPMLIPKRSVRELLGISQPILLNLVKSGKLTESGNRITIGSVARFLCE